MQTPEVPFHSRPAFMHALSDLWSKSGRSAGAAAAFGSDDSIDLCIDSRFAHPAMNPMRTRAMTAVFMGSLLRRTVGAPVKGHTPYHRGRGGCLRQPEDHGKGRRHRRKTHGAASRRKGFSQAYLARSSLDPPSIPAVTIARAIRSRLAARDIRARRTLVRPLSMCVAMRATLGGQDDEVRS